jgi:hypothetical protein
MRSLATTTNPEARQLLAEVSVGLTVAQAAAAPKMFQLKRQLGEQVLVKLLVVILRAFIDSLRVPDKPDAADILELADTLAQTYTHDSLKDIILALKQARTNGTQFYQSLDVSKLYQLIADYFDRKGRYLETQHHDNKARSTSTEHSAVVQLAAAGAAVSGIGHRLDPSHPNHESLRRKLTITNGKARRGLITPEQADEQRQQVQQANQRKARRDWQPHEAAARRIDSSNRAEDRRLMDKYSQPNQ